MVIIAFSEKTSKILPRILCRHLRHCAPIITNKDDLVMYQFITRHNVEKIHLRTRDISLLRAHGWQFIYVPISAFNINCIDAYSCVDLSKRVLNIHSVFIQTPYSLYKYLTRK